MTSFIRVVAVMFTWFRKKTWCWKHYRHGQCQFLRLLRHQCGLHRGRSRDPKGSYHACAFTNRGRSEDPKGSLLGLCIHQGPCAWTQPFTMSSMGSSEYSRSRDTEGNYLLVGTDIQQGPGSMVLRVYVHMSAR